MSAVAACAVLAALELDSVLVAQTMISRPFVTGTLLGALTGKTAAGALLGATFELLSLCDLPVGGCLTWSATVAAGTAAVLASRGLPLPLCFAAGLAAGALHSRVEALERTRRATTCGALAERAEKSACALGRAMGLSIAAHAAMTFATALAIVSAAEFVHRNWWAGAPVFLRDAALLVSSSAPWLGLSGVAAWGLRRA